MRQGCSAWRLATALGFLSAVGVLRAGDSSDEGMTVRTYPVADLVIPLASSPEDGRQAADFESLIDLVELRTGADCWKDGGGRGAISHHDRGLSLVIRQSAEVHERIADLLEELRGSSELAVKFDVSIFEGPLPGCTDCGTPGESMFGLVDETGRQRLLDEVNQCSGVKQLASPTVLTFNGQTATVAAEQAGSVMKLELRSQVSDDHRYLRLEVDSLVDDAASHSECLIPDGYTAVRPLVPQKSWVMVTARVVGSSQPEEVHPRPLAAAPIHTGPRFVVPAEDLTVAEGVTAIELLLSGETPSVGLRLASGADVYVEEANSSPPLLLLEPQQASPAVPEPPAADDSFDEADPSKESAIPVPQKLESEEPRTVLLDLNFSAEIGAAAEPGSSLMLGLIAPPPRTTAASEDECSGVLTLHAPREVADATAVIPPLPEPATLSPPDFVGVIADAAADVHDAVSKIIVANAAVGTDDFESVVVVSSDDANGVLFNSEPSVAPPPALVDSTQPAPFPPVISSFPLPRVVPGPGDSLADANVMRKPVYRSSRRRLEARIPGVAVNPQLGAPVQQISAEAVQQGACEHLAAAARLLEESGLSDQATAVRELEESVSSGATARLREIEAEITRLKVEQAKLEHLETSAKPFVFQSGGVQITR